MSVYFLIQGGGFVLVQRTTSLCRRTVNIIVWHHLVMVSVEQGMQALPVDQSERFPDSVSPILQSRGYYMLFLFLFVLLLKIVVVMSIFFKGQQHDFYRNSRVQILCCCYNASELRKTLSFKGLRQLRLISFQ